MASIQSVLDQPKILLISGGAIAGSQRTLIGDEPTRPIDTTSSVSRNATLGTSGGSQPLPLSRLRIQGPDEEIGDADARMIDQLVKREIDEPFQSTAEGLWEETRVVLRKTLQYASDTLAQGPKETTNTEQPHAQADEQDEQVITFEIPGGRLFQLPYNAVQDWNVSSNPSDNILSSSNILGLENCAEDHPIPAPQRSQDKPPPFCRQQSSNLA
jgi:hypothetical protein